MSGLTRHAARWTSLGRDAKLILLYTAIKSLGNSAFMLFFNLYVLSLGFQNDFVGSLRGLNAIPAIFLSLGMGILARRVGAKRSLLMAGGGIAATYAALALASNAPALIAARLAFATATLLAGVSFSPMLSNCCEDHQRATLFSTNQSLMRFMDVVGNLVAGLLPGTIAVALGVGAESALAYRGTLLLASGFALLALIPLSMVRAERDAAVPSAGFDWQLLRRRIPLWGRLILPDFLMSFGIGLFIPFFNVYFKQEFAISDVKLGTIVAVSGLLTGFATLAGPWLSERVGQMRAILMTEGLSIPFMLALSLATDLRIVLVAYWLRAALMRMSNPLYMSFMMSAVPADERSMLNSLWTLFYSAGSAITAFVSGHVQMRHGFQPIFFVATAFYSVAIAVTYFLFGRSQPTEPA